MKKTIFTDNTKRIFLLLSLFVLYTTVAKATNCSSRVFQEEKINLAICDNYDRSGERLFLLFKARTKVLNDYIKDKIAKGELQDKKFEISMSDPIYMRYMELTQGKNGYFVDMSGISYPTLGQLMTIVDYFAQPNWKPFIVDFSYRRDDETNEAAERRYEAEDNKITNFLKSGVGYAPYAYQPFTIWKRDNISLEYSSDSLRYLIDEKPLSFQANATLPVKIKDRYIFFQDDNIFVVQDMEIIKTFKFQETYYGEDYAVYVHSKWVNICWHSDIDSWIYSYSYDKNRFYENTK